MSKMLMDSLVRQKSILESEGYSVAYICIYGSQNYGLDLNTEEYQSDIDMKAIIIPTLDDLVADSKPVSIVVDTEWGQCDVKDIRLYFQTLLKGNPAYIETLFTDYYVVDNKFQREFDTIISLRNDLVSALSAQFVRAIYGMMCEKQKALCHPYPSIAHKIEKHGYDGKQAHHILRLWFVMTDYILNGKRLEECLRLTDEGRIEALMQYKLNRPSLEVASQMVDHTMGLAKNLRDSFLEKVDESKMEDSVSNTFLKLSQDIIKHKIIEEVKGAR